jgi:hypothetical protein
MHILPRLLARDMQLARVPNPVASPLQVEDLPQAGPDLVTTGRASSTCSGADRTSFNAAALSSHSHADSGAAREGRRPGFGTAPARLGRLKS